MPLIFNSETNLYETEVSGLTVASPVVVHVAVPYEERALLFVCTRESRSFWMKYMEWLRETLESRGPSFHCHIEDRLANLTI
jgi:hypothetical protein